MSQIDPGDCELPRRATFHGNSVQQNGTIQKPALRVYTLIEFYEKLLRNAEYVQ